jgi:CRP-like cAMP-binding protein
VPSHVIKVLDADPGLGEALADEARAMAVQQLVAKEVRVDRGEWQPERPLGRSAGDLGYLVLDGLLVRETALGRHATAELLGKGDVLRPWDHIEDGDGAAPLDTTHAWRVLQPVRFAVLDARFAVLAARWPAIGAELISRVLRRSRQLGMMLALSSMPRLDARLLALLWYLADRWGVVTPDGVLVPLRLTHQTLAQLAGAQRPSVTSALSALETRGLVRRATGDFGYLLLGDPPGDPEQALAHQDAASAT